ncbi:unnamed protein product [Ectocarpus sp. 12 AP-2014]
MVQVPFDLTNTRFKRATGSAYYFRWRRRAGDAMVAGVGLEGNKATRAGSSSEGVMGVIAVTNGVNVLTHQHLNRHSDFFCAVFLLLPDRPSFFSAGLAFLFFFCSPCFRGLFFAPLGWFSVPCMCGEIDWTLLVALLSRFVLYYVRLT